MAEDLNYAEIHFWLCIKYVHDCHESGELSLVVSELTPA